MNNLLRTLIAGYGAKKLGGGCFSTVLIFIVLFVLLGQCGDNRSSELLLDAPDAVTQEAPRQSHAPAVALAAPASRLHTVAP